MGASTAALQPRAWQRWLDNTTIRVGVNNVFDEPPPFRGRYYYIGLNKKF